MFVNFNDLASEYLCFKIFSKIYTKNSLILCNNSPDGVLNGITALIKHNDSWTYIAHVQSLC